ncbi:hypothetical protein GDO78_003313 [Eleutherodactylus coqui]|uniref:Carboxylic ester hydrolase n=1 Tax=Eleutherodactylus coqui TaxID=57060 RepID=A0A8J6JYU0_ELECQ|nr:hypothetical protein GDO78_003313 [Eleutherodactylus coqui]
MGALMRVVVLCTLALGVLASGQDDDYPQVETKYGKLRGKTLSAKETDRTVHAFYGVPFAKPPVGSLRFAAPESPTAWSSIREALDYAPMCLQDTKMMEQLLEITKAKFSFPPVSEDCLYLNIFTPADRMKDKKLPVMVYIHGGALVMGGSMMFEGSAFGAHENVVVVSIQYRLGLMGFFSTGDDRAPGNYGFLDQVAALKWVSENIADFGGDPDIVTIFGVSAGGLSVSALVASPLAKGLFHRAIAESGVAIFPGLVAKSTEEVVFVSNVVANISGCSEDTLVECLMAKSEDEILAIAASMTVPNLPVCVDGVVLTEPSEETLYTKQVYSAPLIIGVNDQECGWLLPKLLNASDILEEMDKETVLENLKNFPHLGVSPHMIPSLVDEYFGGTDDPAELRNRFLDLCGDVSLVIPSLRAARYHRDSGSPVFFYEFQHRPSVLKDRRSAFVKSDHGDELMFVFGGPFLRDGAFFSMGDAPDEERTLSKTVMKYWANFARNGDPNGPGLVLWPQFDHEEGYLEINLKQRLAKDLRPGKTEFWTEKIQKIPSNKHTEL